MDRPTLWASADVEVAMSPTHGLTLHVYADGTHHQVFAHDLPVMARLLRIAPRPAPGHSLGRVNFHNNAIALPADPRHSAGLHYFSFSSEPLSPCSFERDEALAREFDSLTGDLQLS